jgi:hypothetical protein
MTAKCKQLLPATTYYLVKLVRDGSPGRRELTYEDIIAPLVERGMVREVLDMFVPELLTHLGKCKAVERIGGDKYRLVWRGTVETTVYRTS